MHRTWSFTKPMHFMLIRIFIIKRYLRMRYRMRNRMLDLHQCHSLPCLWTRIRLIFHYRSLCCFTNWLHCWYRFKCHYSFSQLHCSLVKLYPQFRFTSCLRRYCYINCWINHMESSHQLRCLYCHSHNQQISYINPLRIMGYLHSMRQRIYSLNCSNLSMWCRNLRHYFNRIRYFNP